MASPAAAEAAGAAEAGKIFSHKKSGAIDWDRTSDLLVTNELLCQLSYNGILSVIIA